MSIVTLALDIFGTWREFFLLLPVPLQIWKIVEEFHSTWKYL